MSAFSVVLGPCEVCREASASFDVGVQACAACGAIFSKVCANCSKKPCNQCKGKLAPINTVFPHSAFKAISEGDLDKVRNLLRGNEHTLDTIFDQNGRSLLHAAAAIDNKEGAEDITRYLIDMRIPVGIRNRDGRTVLMSLSSSRRFQKAMTALFKGTENVRDNLGRTALMFAARGWSGWGAEKGNMKIARELIEMGADPLIADNGGKTALGYALDVNKAGQNDEMVEFLKHEMVKATALSEFRDRYSFSFQDKTGVLKYEARQPLKPSK